MPVCASAGFQPEIKLVPAMEPGGQGLQCEGEFAESADKKPQGGYKEGYGRV